MKTSTIDKCKNILKDKKHNKYFYSLTFKRHIDDIKRFRDSEEFRFNEKLGKAYVIVIEELKHVKGEKANENFILEEWQKAYIEILFGWEWKNSKGEWVRRFSTAYTFIARKNGKSILASGIAIADMILRPEVGGEVKIAATKKEQAMIVYNDIIGQLRRHATLSKKIHEARGVTTYLQNETTFSTLGSEVTAAKEDGFNASVGIIDEFSAHGTRALFDIIESSMGARKQPLMYIITTAGFHLGSPSINEYEHSKKILLGTYEDDHYFAFVAGPMDKNGKMYKKFSDNALYASNPNIGVSVNMDFLVKSRNSARADSSKLTNYLTKHENRFVSQSEVFISLDDWKRNALDEEPDFALASDKIMGLDLALNDDFVCLATVYKFSDTDYYLKTHFYIPEANIINRERQLRAPLQGWVEDKFITATPGNTIDNEYIYGDIKNQLDDDNEYNIELNYDPYKAKTLISKVENDLGFECNSTRQGFVTLTAPTKMLLDLTKKGYLRHDNNPVMNWHISNLVVATDIAGNMKPDKSDPDRKIDGVAATVNTLVSLVEKVGEIENNEIIWL